MSKMRTRHPLFRLTAAVTIVSLVLPASTSPLRAQPASPTDTTPAEQTADPPARVGRLASLRGTVSFHGPADTQWSAASVNYPLAAGDSLWVPAGGEASVEVSASRVSLTGDTQLDLTALDDAGLQASLPQGEIYLRLRGLAPNEAWSVETPRGTIALTGAGRYAVSAGTTDSPTLVTVLEGSAQITGPGIDQRVDANETATVLGSDTFQPEIGPARRDTFVDAMIARERPATQVPMPPPPAVAAMPGGEDLAAYGSWSRTPDYGQVWYPQVAAGWVPYRDGHWAYVAPWGWTWVDDAPWGFAPFHYGRWVEIGGRWAWTPGLAIGAASVPVYRPVYAPALVTFFGVGAGVAVGVGLGAALAAGSTGWCPLGPREEYHPWYRASDRYVRAVNVNHVTNITTINRNVTINNYVNRGAATVVPDSVMQGSRQVRPFARAVPAQTLATARPVFSQQPIRPTMATAGVTPSVARGMDLTPVPGAPVHSAPGPAIRAQAPATAPTPARDHRPPLLGSSWSADTQPNGSQHNLPPLSAPGDRRTPTIRGTPARAPHDQDSSTQQGFTGGGATATRPPTGGNADILQPRRPQVQQPVTPQVAHPAPGAGQPHPSPALVPQIVHPAQDGNPPPLRTSPVPFHGPTPQGRQPAPEFHQPAPQIHQPTAEVRQPNPQIHQPRAEFRQPAPQVRQPAPPQARPVQQFQPAQPNPAPPSQRAAPPQHDRKSGER